MSAASAAASQKARVKVNPHRAEVLQLYRQLLKNAHKYPLRGRRTVVTTEVRSAFRQPALLSEVPYKLTLGWQRNETIKQYAQNMHWFHSRDEVTKEMLVYSQQRDEAKVAEMERCNLLGPVTKKNDDVTKFKSGLFHYHPNYYHKIELNPLKHSMDLWKARGSYGSDTGGPRQKFFVKRYKSMFPQGW
eukprot:PhM_4_TR5489/c0_g1_i1/m.55119